LKREWLISLRRKTRPKSSRKTPKNRELRFALLKNKSSRTVLKHMNRKSKTSRNRHLKLLLVPKANNLTSTLITYLKLLLLSLYPSLRHPRSLRNPHGLLLRSKLKTLRKLRLMIYLNSPTNLIMRSSWKMKKSEWPLVLLSLV